MSIGAIGSASTVASILPRIDGDADDAQQASGVLPAATQTTVSQSGGLLGQLSDLARSNPDQFKAVTSEISQKLKDEASQATGGKATFLNNLADKFNQASQSGDLSSLKPSGAQGHHHGHHHHGGGGSAGGAGQGGQDSVAQVIQQALKDVTGSAATTTASAVAQAAGATQVPATST